MKPQSTLQQIAPYMSLGIQLALTVLVFFFAGWWLDTKLQTYPWLMIGFTLAGSAGALIKFFMTVLQLGKREDERWKSERQKHEE